MPKKKLTAATLEKLKAPSAGQIEYFDAAYPGLALRVTAKGVRSWVYFGRLGGKLKRVTLGRYVSGAKDDENGGLRWARRAADKAAADMIKGIDPTAAKRDEKAKAAQATTFKKVAENFIVRYVDKQGLRSKPEIERCFKKYVYPRWQDRHFTAIKRRDVADLLDDIEDNHGPRQADVVLAYIRKLTNWYAARSDDYVSPIVRGMQRHDGGKRERWLEDDEIRAMWKACDGTYGAFIKILLLTGQRFEKVRTMKWVDISEEGVWTIPTERREKANAKIITLPQMARDIIDAQPRIKDNPYVFAGRGGVAFDPSDKLKKELDTKLPKDMPHWTPHDLRRTARALMSRGGVEPHIAELALGHSIKGIQGVYDNPEEYRPRIDNALQRVADKVDEIVKDKRQDKVVPLHGRAQS